MRLQAHMFEGATGTFAPGFPVLSKLDQMHIDISWLKAGDIPALPRELDIGRAVAHNLDQFTNLLRKDGALVLVGVPSEPTHRRRYSSHNQSTLIAGSLIAGLSDTRKCSTSMRNITFH